MASTNIDPEEASEHLNNQLKHILGDKHQKVKLNKA